MSRIETYCGVKIVREEQSETGQCMRGGGGGGVDKERERAGLTERKST